ncbi:hypothetical protein VB715_20945 [Crocosphaera sp. UHCC 0190]|uniref:hypothetical protein n=1 Tax=Crocosphaera sp. UHCC 0190 TaxID=3110246 RepID=UPI002B21F68F|nr:hypothetical protein [Crocosphaera sp. UHCC 0190]MEA5512243.1 hypothetical protein [Crocosphaera sp. UHCC 0190]
MNKTKLLEAELKQLINQYSLLEILIALKKLCTIANQNQPLLDWDKDIDALTAVIERINN